MTVFDCYELVTESFHKDSYTIAVTMDQLLS